MDVHLTRHNREKALALAEKFEVRKSLLKNAIEKQRFLRKRLYLVKLERIKMRQQTRELTYQGGILAMPSLMYDYDKTVERLKEKQESVAKLRETLKALQRRVDHVEGRSL